jgi:hypothetical protein
MILQRTTTPLSPITMSLINTSLNSAFGISVDQLRNVQHTDTACYVLPILQPYEPIILPGQCDPNINVVRNFNVSGVSTLLYYINVYLKKCIYIHIHTYHKRCSPEGVAEVSQIFLRDLTF